MKLSEFFNLSVDYLLKNIDEELYAIQDKELLKQIAQADNLSDPASPPKNNYPIFSRFSGELDPQIKIVFF